MPRSDIDWTLAALLDSASSAKASFDLTVFCEGLVMIGSVVADEVFFERLGLSGAAESVARIREANLKEAARIADILDNGDTSPEQREGLQSKLDDVGPQYISMVDVTILGAGPAPITTPAWRGRLSQISGWTLGSPGQH